MARAGPAQNQKQTTRAAALLLALLAGAFALRWALFPLSSNDYEVFLQPWFEELATHGGLAAIGRPIGDYTPPYIYILAALTHLPLPSLVSIKLVSCAGDVLLAGLAAAIVLDLTQHKKRAALSFLATLLLPTVLLNSAAWAQCDSLYTAALLGCVLCALRGRYTPSVLCFAVAFAFKLQAVFLSPLLIALFLRRKIRFRQLLLVPGVYLCAVLPAALAGRSLWELLTVYLRQAASYSGLSLGAPNFYAFLHPQNTRPFGVAGICVFAALLALALWWAVRKAGPVPPLRLLTWAAFCAVAVPFLLPYMHERYFYPADVLTLVYAFVLPHRWPVPVLVAGSSLYVYLRYLFCAALPVPVATLPMCAAVCILLADAAEHHSPASSPLAK